jgi:hypothetical protein
MVRVDHAEPADISDRLLWQDAQLMLGRHAEPDRDGLCVWCGWRWPCAPRRVAERADAASRRPVQGRPEAWTLRHDLNSMRALPGLSRRRMVARNRGSFD